MRVAIGTNNQAKTEAVKKAFAQIEKWCKNRLEFVNLEVPSGIGAMPLDDEQTMQGAYNRVVALIKRTAANFYVGLEGGIHYNILSQDKKKPLTHYSLKSWACVSDGKKFYFGCSSAYPLPKGVVEKMFVEGKELGVVADEIWEKENLKNKEGTIGVLTGNLRTRTFAFQEALIAALSPFYNPQVHKYKYKKTSKHENTKT
ncbi:hypothetical protein AUJ78_00245 [Candidatus Peregrinibacteria bacterium CG1_02_41_10]|nr:MAG: hypothetical protein AUJ78_00245 [Candidatus Peregrinibacteria bacterium CG1_02_41_10]